MVAQHNANCKDDLPHFEPCRNTLICDGPSGHIFEVTAVSELVWEHNLGNQAVFRATQYTADYSGLPSVGQ